MTITWRGTREELIARLRLLAPYLAGAAGGPLAPDPQAIVGLLMSVGLTLLGRIYEAYDVKSQGGQDAMGVQWAPLAATTLALRRKDTSRKALGRLQQQFAGLPLSRQRQIKIHYQRLNELYTAGNGGGAAARRHARSLLFRMQRFIAPGRFQRLQSELSGPLKAARADKLAQAGAAALILRDTGRLFNSLGPQINSPDRILRLGPGTIAVGTNVGYFKYHQSDRPRKLKKDGTPRLPRRQILPDEQTPVPAEWRQAMLDTLKDGLRSAEFWRRFLGDQATVAA